MAVSNTNIQTYTSTFATFHTAKESITTHNVSDLDYAQSFFNEKGFITFRLTIPKVKLVLGWMGLKKRDELYETCKNAGFLLVEGFHELNTTYQDFFTVLFRERQDAGLLCAIQWTGNNPTVTRPLNELIIAP